MATPISHEDAAHIYRRLGFGANSGDIDKLAALGRDGAVNYLLNYGSIDNSAMEQVLSQSFNFSDPKDNKNFNQAEIRRWWYTRMALTARQFEEKMTLFWHNHFATALSKVDERFMYLQNLTLRNSALARFDDLLLSVARDPAMLIWLDGITNVAGRPNENWARELQELFTMGINDFVTSTPNYTQSDVTQIARAFTGWQFHLTPGGSLFDYTTVVNPAQHDNGSKLIYGNNANFAGEDVITIIAAREATPRFLVKKLFEFFVYPLDPASHADRTTADKFAAVYLANNHSILELLRAIFTSDEFFGTRARFGLVKNPAEVIAGSIRMLGAKYNPGAGVRRDGTLWVQSLQMGMDIFNPPDVSGWKLNLGWINTATMLQRFNYADQLITNRPADPNAPGISVAADQLKALLKPTAKMTAKNFLAALGPLHVPNPTVRALKNYLLTDDSGNPITFTGDDATVDKKIRGLVHQILALPQSHLN
jgi:uncharacterized protein (DUF1800 family)